MYANGASHGAAPVVSSKRMTYGSISSNNREARDRQELFAGADPYRSPWQQQQQQQQQVPQDDMSNAELMQQAVAQHKETTDTARRAVKVMHETQQLQVTTQAALEDQRHQMHRIESDMDKIGQDLTYSERILRFMKLCCCVGFFCSCCTEPGRANSDKKWRHGGPPPTYEPDMPPHQQSMQQQRGKKHAAQQQQQRGSAPGASAYPDVNTRGLEEIGLGEQAAVINAETQQQNAYLDEISKGLDQLKFNAQVMHQELRYQESHADRIRTDADELQGKLHNVNRQGFKRI